MRNYLAARAQAGQVADATRTTCVNQLSNAESAACFAKLEAAGNMPPCGGVVIA
jgi:hypothetical protein